MSKHSKEYFWLLDYVFVATYLCLVVIDQTKMEKVP
jgi:hypothetical protein